MKRAEIRARLSRVLRWFGDQTSRAGVAALVAVVVVAFLIALAVEGNPQNWDRDFEVAAAAITLIMLFVIQHTQSHQQMATQLKLDELIRSSPEADDLLVHIELAPDEEINEREQDQIAHHEALRDDDSDSGTDANDDAVSGDKK
jgi:low affinity Fe/Cu permease